MYSKEYHKQGDWFIAYKTGTSHEVYSAFTKHRYGTERFGAEGPRLCRTGCASRQPCGIFVVVLS